MLHTESDELNLTIVERALLCFRGVTYPFAYVLSLISQCSVVLAFLTLISTFSIWWIERYHVVCIKCGHYND